jgi:asparagine synthase (glutamine-hydrolysing)
MCGIFSAFTSGANRLNIDTNIFQVMASKVMKRRGPDHFDFYISDDKNALVAHSRLAIQGIDSYSNQPYRCKSGGILVYNGELYNADEIGHSDFSAVTSSDTPIFAEAIIDRRLPLSNVDGMFAFVHYDVHHRRVYAGRDIYGEKPLFRYEAKGNIFLFSELRYISLLPLFDIEVPEIDMSFIKRLLLYGYRKAVSDSGNISCRQGVEMIAAGTTLDIELDSLHYNQTCFYNIKDKFVNRSAEMSFEEDVGYELFSRRVSLRNVSDVSTAVCLSGGVDSTLVTAILCDTDKPPALALTLHSDDKRYSESEIARQTADQLGIKHKLVYISGSRVDGSPVDRFIELSGMRGSPFLTLTSFVSTYLYSACSSEGCKVLFSGIGGDELFSGYYDYFLYRMLADDYSGSESDGFNMHILPLLRNPILRKGAGALPEVKSLKHHYFDIDTRAKFFLGQIPFLTNSSDGDNSLSLLRQRMLADLTSEVVPVILYEDDLNAMHFSVENRSPLLSREILEYAVRLSEASLMVNGYQKYPLRKLLEKTGKARHIAFNRRKVGFNFSLDDFIKTDPNRINEMMNEESALWHVIRKSDAIEAVWDSSLSESFRFMVISLQVFLVMNSQ